MPDVMARLPLPWYGRERWATIDQHKLSLVAATLPAVGGTPEVCRLEATSGRSGGSWRSGAGRRGGGWLSGGAWRGALRRLLTKLGVACDVVAPSLIPVRAGDRVKTDRRDAKKLVSLYRAGMLRFVYPPTPELEGLRDLLGRVMICGACGWRRGTGAQAAVASRTDLPGGEDGVDEAAPPVARGSAPRRSARARGA